jgi:hypothetical protein
LAQNQSADFAASPGAKLSYFEGTIETLMPGRDHEIFNVVSKF